MSKLTEEQKDRQERYWQTVTVPAVEQITGYKMLKRDDWRNIPDLSLFEGKEMGFYKILKYIPNHIESVKDDGSIRTSQYFIASNNGKNPSLYRVANILSGRSVGCGRGKGGKINYLNMLSNEEPEEHQLELEEEKQVSPDLTDFRSEVMSRAYSYDERELVLCQFALTNSELNRFQAIATANNVSQGQLLHALIKTFIQE